MFKAAKAKISFTLLLALLALPVGRIHAQAFNPPPDDVVTGGDPEPPGEPDVVTGGDPEPPGEPDVVTGGDPEPPGEPDVILLP